MHHEVNYWHTEHENDYKYSFEKIIKPIIHWMAKYLHLKSWRGLYHAAFTTKCTDGSLQRMMDCLLISEKPVHPP